MFYCHTLFLVFCLFVTEIIRTRFDDDELMESVLLQSGDVLALDDVQLG